jgi:hypothetical protein
LFESLQASPACPSDDQDEYGQGWNGTNGKIFISWLAENTHFVSVIKPNQFSLHSETAAVLMVTLNTNTLVTNAEFRKVPVGGAYSCTVYVGVWGLVTAKCAAGVA